MPKLKLKRTPEEEAERHWRKAKRAAKKAAKQASRSYYSSDEESYHSHSSSRKLRKTEHHDKDVHTTTWDDIDSECPPQTSSSAHKPDYDTIRAQLEEERFREKMWDAAFDDREQLDALEARMNDFAHVPSRWRNRIDGLAPEDDISGLDPQYMNEDDYAEWVRAGMWRKKHAEEHAEQLRKKAEKTARRAREKELRAETARIEKAAEEERRARKMSRESRRLDRARVEYDRRWQSLLGDGEEGIRDGLQFGDIPWPIYTQERESITRLEDITQDSISKFLLVGSLSSASGDTAKKERKEKLRETMLRFHPDKFEGRIMGRVRKEDRGRVQEAVGQIARALNALMNS